jgi:hypothetical protein
VFDVLDDTELVALKRCADQIIARVEPATRMT